MVEWAPRNSCPSVYVLRVSSSCLLPLQKTLQDLQVGLTQSPFKWLHLSCILECEILWVPYKSGVSISNRLLCFMKLGLSVLQSQKFWGLLFLVQDPQSGEPLLLWRISAVVIFSWLVIYLTEVVFLIMPQLLLSYTTHRGYFFISLVVKYIFF